VTGWHASKLTDVIESCRPQQPAKPNILKALLTIQASLGHVPISGLSQIAKGLGVTDADVAAVLSYYPDLRVTAPGRHVIRVCMGESCMAHHCSKVTQAVERYLAEGAGKTITPERFTLEKVYCMGNCALSPTVAVDHDLYGRVDPGQIVSLLERYP